LALMTLVQKIG